MSEQTNQRPANQPTQKLVGMLAEYGGPEQLVKACSEARKAGIRRFDAYSPFPVHGIDPAIGIRRTRLPFITLTVGISGLIFAMFLQYFVNATESWGPFSGYKFIISGKPFWSLPANIPVGFAVTVLSSAFTTVFAMLILNRLPRFANPLHRIARFKSATSNGFFMMIEAEDPNYNPREIEGQLSGWGAVHTEMVHEDLTDQQLPSFVKSILVLMACLCLIPPALVYRMQGETHSKPRLHVVPDMDWMYKSKPGQASPVIAKSNASHGETKKDFKNQAFGTAGVMQLYPEGTIRRGGLREDSAFFEGIAPGGHLPPGTTDPAKEPKWVTSFPKKLSIDGKLIERGRERFDIYCAACHGVTGIGDGLVNRRAMAFAAKGQDYSTWTAAKSLHDPAVVKQDVGRIFDTISNGRGKMGPYKAQISPEDRWAIVLYIKALQDTHTNAKVQNEDGELVPLHNSGKTE